MKRYAYAVALLLSLALSSRVLGAPLARSSLPVGTAYTDTAQTWTEVQGFPMVKLTPRSTPSTAADGSLYFNKITKALALRKNGTWYTVVVGADSREATMQASRDSIPLGAWTRLNIVGLSGQVTLAEDTLNVTVTYPPGVIVASAGASAPDGWLLCYGQAVSRTSYSGLFAAIGTLYGNGNGVDTFNVPDLRGRSIFGKDNMGGVSASRLTTGVDGSTLGAVGGVDRTVITSSISNHTHSLTYVTSGLGVGDIHVAVQNGLGGNYSTGATGVTTGSDTTYSNIPPAAVLNWIIKW